MRQILVRVSYKILIIILAIVFLTMAPIFIIND